MEKNTETFEQLKKLISNMYEIIKNCEKSNYDNIFTSISDTFYHYRGQNEMSVHLNTRKNSDLTAK